MNRVQVPAAIALRIREDCVTKDKLRTVNTQHVRQRPGFLCQFSIIICSTLCDVYNLSRVNQNHGLIRLIRLTQGEEEFSGESDATPCVTRNILKQLETNMASSSFLMRLVSSSVSVANKAGGIIRSILKTRSLAVVDKGNDGQFDPQTEADRASQKCIIGSLLKMYPTLQIIGEEEGIQLNEEYIIEVLPDVDVLRKSCPEALASVKPEEVTVWVDPLDGTREFTEGLYDHVTVLIGISMNGKPIAGIIHQPFYGYEKNPQGTELGRTMWGVRGLGTFGFNHNPPPKGRCVVTTTRTHLHKTAMEAIEAMKPDQILKVGGAGYKVLLLLEGTADVYVFASRGCQRWDTCAGEALLEAVGGTLTDICGEHIKYDGHASSYANNTGVLASLKDHKLYVDMIPESVKGHLLRKL